MCYIAMLSPAQSQSHALSQLPTISNAVGGILVGLVTAHAGGVRKVSRSFITRQQKNCVTFFVPFCI